MKPVHFPSGSAPAELPRSDHLASWASVINCRPKRIHQRGLRDTFVLEAFRDTSTTIFQEMGFQKSVGIKVDENYKIPVFHWSDLKKT